MLGYYNYTTWLTYISLFSASMGIMISLNGMGHPYIGVFFLLFSGICDAFDGRVARSKKNRTDREKKFGIQIDSLTDLVAFGVLPACIGIAMVRVSPFMPPVALPREQVCLKDSVMLVAFFIILCLYILAALVRLAYFNVMEEERQQVETGNRKYFQGLPVTSAAMIFPTVLLLNFITPQRDLTVVYFAVMLATMLAFVLDVRIPKPGLKGILILMGIGMLEFIVFLFGWFIL